MLRGEPSALARVLAATPRWAWASYLLVVIAGAGGYGIAMGLSKAPLQGLYTGLKLPLLILLTTLGTALLNGMLAPLLGLNMSFRQSLRAVQASFTVASVILAGFAPVVLFFVWNMPSLAAISPATNPAYQFLKLVHVTAIAVAGTVGNVRLFGLLATLSGERWTATKVLFSWLAANLLLGSQLCWILRPFIGAPDHPIEFLSVHNLEGNFFEDVWAACAGLISR